MIRDFPVNFIAKVPETIEECQELEYKDVDFITLDIDPQYSYYLTTSSYAGVDQQWLLVHSTYGDSKQKDVFERRLRKDMSMGSNALKVLVKQGFPSEAEAKREAENWISKYKRLKFESLDVFKSEVNPYYKIRCHKAEQIPGNIYYITG
jgi:transposase